MAFRRTTEDTPPETTAAPVSGMGLDEMDDVAIAFDGEKASGGFDGPSWQPNLVEFSTEVIRMKLEKLGKGSSYRPEIAGTLVVGTAWGKSLYFLDVPLKDKTSTRVHLPEHFSLYGSLGLVEVGAKVRLKYVGRAKKAKPGQTAPVLYEVIGEKGRVLSQKRADALEVISSNDPDASDASP